MMYMDITPYIQQITQAMTATAASLPEADQQLAARLTGAIEPAARLAFMEAMSAAAAEISAALPSTIVGAPAGQVNVHLVGRDLNFDVQAPTPVQAPQLGDDDNSARITLRLPESVKADAERCAAGSGQSLNTWLVSVIRTAAQAPQAFPGATASFSGPRWASSVNGWI